MSEITLRRANKLRVKVEARVQEIRREFGNTNISINLFSSNASGKVTERQNKIAVAIGRFVALNTVLGELREQIAQKNVQSGVSAILAQKATMERLRDMYRQLSGTEPAPNQDEMSSLIEARKKNFENSAAGYGSHDEVQFSVLQKDVIDSATDVYEQLVADISSAEDKIEQLNATSRITLAPTSDAVLQSEKLI